MSVTVLVTGANSGIGLAAVGELLDRGASVVATVRSEEAADEVRSRHGGVMWDSDARDSAAHVSAAHDSTGRDTADLVITYLDVTDADRCAEVIDEVRPDVVVNNAGSALLGAVVDIGDDDARDQLDALVVGPVRLARLAARHQATMGSGRIVNVSSMLASANIPFTGWYGAAKAALDSISDTMRIELESSNISVISVECGAVSTDVWDEAGDDVESGSDTATAAARHRWVQLTDAARPHFVDPVRVGTAIADAALDPHPKRIYRVGFGSRLGVLSGLVPRLVQDRVTELVFRLGAVRPT